MDGHVGKVADDLHAGVVFLGKGVFADLGVSVLNDEIGKAVAFGKGPAAHIGDAGGKGERFKLAAAEKHAPADLFQTGLKGDAGQAAGGKGAVPDFGDAGGNGDAGKLGAAGKGAFVDLLKAAVQAHAGQAGAVGKGVGPDLDDAVRDGYHPARPVIPDDRGAVVCQRKVGKRVGRRGIELFGGGDAIGAQRIDRRPFGGGGL